MPTFQYNPQSYISAKSPEFQQASREDIIDFANLGLFIPFQVTSYAEATIAEKVNIDIYLELFGILREGYQVELLTKEFLAEFMEIYNKLPFNRKAELNREIHEELKEHASVLGLAMYAIEDENEGLYGLDNILTQLPDKERLQMLYYIQTGEELTDELQAYLEQDLVGSDIVAGELSAEEVGYLARTATSRYTDKGAVVVNDADVQIPNTNNPSLLRSNVPITRERLKEMMNSQSTEQAVPQATVVDELRQKNTKAYTNIPGLIRPNAPVVSATSAVPLPKVESTRATTSNIDYSDYQ